jgi:geranylgeranyl pyrophosphate synthase
VIDATERACIDLIEGETAEVPLSKSDHTVASSLEISRKKTAALFWLAAQVGTHVALAKRIPNLTLSPIVSQMAIFGEQLGIAFQILDDIMDVTSEQDLMGKRTGVDLRERKPTIVNVLWLQTNSPLAQRLKTPASGEDEEFVSNALQELRISPVISQARTIALEHAKRAESALRTATQLAGPEANPLELAALQVIIKTTLDRLG